MMGINTTFKYVRIGDKFEHVGQIYTKTNHMRGFYQDETKKTVYKSFNNKTPVKDESGLFNTDIGK